ncbi:MAG: cardiolipin synthase ClsB [Burkholderiaceae bacterium]
MASPRLNPDHLLRLLVGGDDLFPALIDAIDAARAEILLESYIFDFSGAVIGVAEALERAAGRGVAVRVVVDGVGTGEIPSPWQARWRAAGVQWRVFNPVHGWRVLFPRHWRRMHRKLCVVDGEVAFCGGINLLDDYHDPNHGALEAPRVDFAVRVQGPLVADVHDAMTRLWWRFEAAREAREFDFEHALEAVQIAARQGDNSAPAPLETGPGPSAALVLRDNVRYRRRIESTYRLAISQARSEVIIANAYFVPGVSLQRALLRAARRGVKVTLLLQGRYEYFMQYHASRAVYGGLLAAGIEIVEYDASFLHAKVAVMDNEAGALATIGSSNLDPFSLLLAREANVFVRDDAFSTELRGHLMRALEQGRRVDAAAHMKRPLHTRGLTWLAYAVMRIGLLITGKRY